MVDEALDQYSDTLHLPLIMVLIKGIKAIVRVNGNEAAEYDDDQTTTTHVVGDSHVTKYVESSTSATFSVEVTCKKDVIKPSEGLRCYLQLDGSLMNCVTLRRSHNRHKFEGTYTARDGVYSIQSYHFADLITRESSGSDGSEIAVSLEIDEHGTSGDSSADRTDDIKKLGEINLRFHRVRKMRKVLAPTNYVIERPIAKKSADESALKGRAIDTRVRCVFS